MNQTKIQSIISEIIAGTLDGNQLSPQHLTLIQSAVNGFSSEKELDELKQIHQLVKEGKYTNWFHNIEHLTLDHSDFIRWKGRVVAQHTSETTEEEKAAVKEIHSRCLYVESLSLTPNKWNCDFYWDETYKNLKSDTVSSAYPWVEDYYRAGENRWKEIDEKNYDWYLECVPPIAMNSSSFLNGEPYTHTDKGKPVYLACRCQNKKYYAQLMTVEEYKIRIYEPIHL